MITRVLAATFCCAVTCAGATDILVPPERGNCAANALYVCMKWSGRTVSPDDLRQLLNRSSGFYSISELIEVANANEMNMAAYTCGVADLKDCAVPFIAVFLFPVNGKQTNHFTPIVEVDRDRGLRAIDLNYSSKASTWFPWSEVALLFTGAIIQKEVRE